MSVQTLTHHTIYVDITIVVIVTTMITTDIVERTCASFVMKLMISYLPKVLSIYMNTSSKYSRDSRG